MNATVGILTCLWAWNDFLLPLIYLQSEGNKTLALGLRAFGVAGMTRAMGSASHRRD